MTVEASKILEFLFLAKKHNLNPRIEEVLEGFKVSILYPGDLTETKFCISHDNESYTPNKYGFRSIRSVYENLISYVDSKNRELCEKREEEREKLINSLTDYQKELLGITTLR
jgi:hypothetical protein